MVVSDEFMSKKCAIEYLKAEHEEFKTRIEKLVMRYIYLKRDTNDSDRRTVVNLKRSSTLPVF